MKKSKKVFHRHHILFIIIPSSMLLPPPFSRRRYYQHVHQLHQAKINQHPRPFPPTPGTRNRHLKWKISNADQEEIRNERPGMNSRNANQERRKAVRKCLERN
jgi:hypothetical protein